MLQLCGLLCLYVNNKVVKQFDVVSLIRIALV